MQAMRKINAAGAAIIKDYEGYRDRAYQDGNGLWTCGWGHTAGVDADTVCTPEIAEGWFDKDCEEAEQAVCDLVEPVLSDNELTMWGENSSRHPHCCES
jgi:lysozyme